MTGDEDREDKKDENRQEQEKGSLLTAPRKAVHALLRRLGVSPENLKESESIFYLICCGGVMLGSLVIFQDLQQRRPLLAVLAALVGFSLGFIAGMEYIGSGKNRKIGYTLVTGWVVLYVLYLLVDRLM